MDNTPANLRKQCTFDDVKNFKCQSETKDEDLKSDTKFGSEIIFDQGAEKHRKSENINSTKEIEIGGEFSESTFMKKSISKKLKLDHV